jgi:hypothetical protein
MTFINWLRGKLRIAPKVARCGLCGRPLSVAEDPMSSDAGGDCWGCIGKIEADLGWDPSVQFVRQEVDQGVRFEDGTPKPPPS